MSGMRFAEIEHRAKDVLALTSLTLGEFRELVPPFEEQFQTYMSQWRLDGKKRTKRVYTTYANCPLPAPEDRLLFVLSYLKTNPLQVAHGRLFGMPQNKANQWIHTLLPVLKATLKALGDTPSRSLDALAQRLEAHVQAAPLFRTTGPNARLAAPRMPVNRKASIAARKGVIP